MPKLQYVFARLKLAVYLWPLRLRRFILHFGRMRATRLAWWADLSLLFSELLLLFDGYEILSNLFARHTRALTPAEVQILQEIYGESLPYRLIRIDERAHIGPKQANFCYVSFHTINSWGPMPAAILVHEAMHVWQYLHFGAAYIGLALRAQRTEMGYNYGGAARLRENPRLADFNFEQQGDIMADAYRTKHGRLGRWADAESQFADYLPFLAEISAHSIPAAYR